MYNIIYNTHKIVVLLFLLIYLVKTVLLLANKTTTLAKFTKLFRIPEMIVSTLFLVTGIYMLAQGSTMDKFMIIKLVAVFASIPIAIIGFKKSNKLLAALALLLIIGAYGLAEVRKKKAGKGIEKNISTTASGEELYINYCSRCHGDDGMAGLSGATDLSFSQMDDTSLHELFLTGKNSMPPFKELSNEQIESITAHIKTFRK